MIRQQLVELIATAIRTAQQKGDLPAFDLPEIVVERPKDPTHGDFATPVAMGLARLARLAPLQIAHKLSLICPPPITSAAWPWLHPVLSTCAWPKPGWPGRSRLSWPRALLLAGSTWAGRKKSRLNISAPTRPARWWSAQAAMPCWAIPWPMCWSPPGIPSSASITSTMSGLRWTIWARLCSPATLRRWGKTSRIRTNTRASIWSRWVGRPRSSLATHICTGTGAEALVFMRQHALDAILASLKTDTALIGIKFDRWFSEQSLYDNGTYQLAFEKLQAKNMVTERDGATWLKSEDEEDKENVIVRSDGRPTYFASDIAYVWDKLAGRGFEWAIYVWGADHHGHVKRVKNATRALGLDADKVTIILYQLVTITRDGVPVRQAKRTGNFTTVREVVEEIGPDAFRFMLLTRSADSSMELDLALAAKQSNENPVFMCSTATPG
ncbi:MAG: arginine--tRNA ligase [Anaerolineales bacterium]|nr:arginine--tRNA ligase [Anaerolineales bacterium]